MSKITHIIKRSGAVVSFKKERISNAIFRAAVAVGGRNKEVADKLANEVVEILNKNYSDEETPHIEDIQDTVEKVLIKNGHTQVSKAYILYRNNNIQRRKDKAIKASSPSTNIPWHKIWKILDWSVTRNLHTVADLNKRIKNGEFPHIVHESEMAYAEEVALAAELIANRIDKLKMVLITGPSSSGKTTTTIKLEQHLNKLGYKFKMFAVDNYFYDLSIHPKDEFGDYDFETPQALDLELINEHIELLCNGKEVNIPFYDFKSGTRFLDKTPMKLEKNEILLIDSLHGLYPEMTKSIDDEYKFKLYLEPMFQIKDNNGKYLRWTDIRLIRRMLRDSIHRAYNPAQTLEHWHYVRSSEVRHIIPYLNTADYIINSAMPYELPIYKARLGKDFEKWAAEYKDNELKKDAFLRASRINEFMQQVSSFSNELAIPPDSVIREFIGGSIHKY
ncbi:MAG: ATP cone domain-containing protein [Candidatus Tenebribacter davisii]|nr:ATP cone domain-containing protein [Candidatus Tenebribacter davisii]